MAGRRKLRGQASEVSIEAFAQRAAFRVARTGLRENDEVARRKRGLQTERLAREPLQAIAVDGVLRDAPRNRETEPRDFTAAGTSEHGEISIARTNWVAEYPAEVLRGVKTLPGRESCGARGDR
jgi:hypothetical protein